MIAWIKELWARYVAYILNQPENMPIEAPVSPVEPVPAPEAQTAPVQPPVPVQSHLDIFTTAIKDFEGGPGDLNYTNNNPGNARCSPEGYLSKYGDVQCVETASGKFAKFPTYALGWEYLQALVMEMVNAHPTWDFVDFFNVYSPTGDNNDPTQYALFVAKRCGVGITTILKTYLG